MKSFYTTLIIVSFCLVSIFFLIFGFTFLKHFTDWKIADVKGTVEFWCMIITPTVAIVGTYFVVTSFRQQVEANNIQRDALNIEKRRFDINNGYDRIIDFINEINKFKSYLLLNDEVEEFTGFSAIPAYNEHLFLLINIQDGRRPIMTNRNNPYTPVIKNIAEFRRAIVQYLSIVTLTANYIIKFSEYKDDSHIILKTRFFKEIENLVGELELMINRINEIKAKENYSASILIHANLAFKACNKLAYAKED